MSRFFPLIIALLASNAAAYAKVVVFWQDGFPTIESQPVTRATLQQAFGDKETIFAGTADLNKPGALKDADLLVLPYGSALPADVWHPNREYLISGGNLLTLGGRPLHLESSALRSRSIGSPTMLAAAYCDGSSPGPSLGPRPS